MSAPERRYAIYFAPQPDTPLWRFGSAVLGYDAATGADVQAIVPPGFDAEAWHRVTADPRRYGFHATLKAPFRLAAGRDEASLVEALRRVAERLDPVDLGRCDVHVVPAASAGGFVAITPAASPAALAGLERAVLFGFEDWRAKLTQDERARRRPDTLTPRQRSNLDRHGYPFVLEDFAFHMTLTGLIEAPRPVAAALQRLAFEAGATGTISLDRLALFRQDAPGQRFRIIAAAQAGR